MTQEDIPVDLQGALQIVALAVRHLHHTRESRPEEQHRLIGRKLDAHDALGGTPAQEIRQQLVGGIPHLENILQALIQLGAVQVHHAVAAHHLIGRRIFSVKADDGVTDRVVGVEPIGIPADRFLDLFLEQHHAAQKNGIHDLLFALEVHIQRRLAVFRLTGNVIHSGLFGSLFCKEPLGRSQNGTTVEFSQCLLLTQHNHTFGFNFERLV